MNIIQYLQQSNATLSNGWKRLVWDSVNEEWQVLYKPFRSKTTQILISTPDEEAAVAEMLRKDNI